MKPMVSVVVPLFNRKKLVQETLQSVRDQTFTEWELIIVDDGSNDGSDEIVKEYAEKDERIKFFYRKRSPKGAPTCRNIGVEKSESEYVIFLDSDDLLAPFCLERRIRLFKENLDQNFLVFPTAVFTKTIEDVNYLWNSLNKCGMSDLDRCLSTDTPWQTTSVIWKKTTLLKLGPWMEGALCRQDLEYHVRALAKKFNYKKFDEVYDNFYRDDNTVRISRTEFKSKEYLESKNHVFHIIHQSLIENGLVDSKRETYLAEYYFESAYANFLYGINLPLKSFVNPLWKLSRISFYLKVRIICYLGLLRTTDQLLGRRVSRKINHMTKNFLLPDSFNRNRYQKKVPINKLMKQGYEIFNHKQKIS